MPILRKIMKMTFTIKFNMWYDEPVFINIVLCFFFLLKF